jgi:hypothetical protein
MLDTLLDGTTYALPFFIAFSSFYQQSLELCATSYPSPLEESAPWPAKLVLLGVAGAYECLTALRDSALIVSGVWLVLFVVWSHCLGECDEQSWHSTRTIVLFLLFGRNFAWRARSFARCASRNGTGVTTRSVVTAFVWHNPAPICYTLCCLWVRWLGAPTLDAIVPNVLLEMCASLSWATKWAAVTWLYPTFVTEVVQKVPKFLAFIALATQSNVHYSMERTRQKLRYRQDLERQNTSSIELALRRCVSGLLQIFCPLESLLTSVLSDGLRRTLVAVDRISVSFTNRYCATSSSPLSVQYHSAEKIRLLSVLSLLSLLLSRAQNLYMFVSSLLEIL